MRLIYLVIDFLLDNPFAPVDFCLLVFVCCIAIELWIARARGGVGGDNKR